MKFRIGISILVIVVMSALYAFFKPDGTDQQQQPDAAPAATSTDSGSSSGSYSGIGK